MLKYIRESFFLLAVLAAAIGTSGTAFAASIDKQGRFLTQRELQSLYSGKTWFWNDGGGYFRRDGRFIAMSGTGKRNSRVKGGWGAYRNGKVCFSGTWKTKRWDAFDSTCFLHRRVGRTIYQKRQPWGKWHVFKRAPTRKNDEYRKFARGNYTNWYVKYHQRAARKATRVARKATHRKWRRPGRRG